MKIRRTAGLLAALVFCMSAAAGCSSEGGAAAIDPTAVSDTVAVLPASSADTVSDSEAEQEQDPREEFGGHRYMVIPSDGAEWEQLRQSCEEQGGYLASIGSAEENDFLFELVLKSGYRAALFGLYRDLQTGEWCWLNGEEFVYANWNEGEPNNSTGVEYYGMFYHDFGDGKWNDGDHSDIEAYICEWD